MKTVIITQARYSSSRLPGKVLLKIGNETMLDVHLKRLKRSKLSDCVLVATTNEKESNEIVEITKNNFCKSYQGSTQDVLDRFYKAALSVNADVIVRVTSDSPLNDGALIDEMVKEFLDSKVDYLSNVHPPTFPDGIDIEIFKFSSLLKAWQEATDSKEREHVTPYIWSRPEIFKIKNFFHTKDLSHMRLTVDHLEDLNLIRHLVAEVGDEPWERYCEYLSENKNLSKLNNSFSRNENY